MSYQKTTGPLMANSHPGSYCGQDAYSDMLITDENLQLSKDRRVQGIKRSENNCSQRLQGCNRLNCARGGEINEPTQGEKILRILQETYGAEEVLQWGIRVLELVQQEEVLFDGLHESGVQSETQKGDSVDDSTLPCEKLVADWILRDMWEQQKCGCSPQGRKPSEQQYRQLAEVMPELPHKSPPQSKDLFGLWRQGQRIGLLRQTLQSIHIQKEHDGMNENVKTVVRRLTPLECERLMGFSDGWTLIGEQEGDDYYYIDTKGKRKKVTDSARYKALGNSICTPFWFWLLRRISAQFERPATLGSLFDGIGGFPYVWEKCNGTGTAVWASEIEEFCIAVTKERFPEYGEE